MKTTSSTNRMSICCRSSTDLFSRWSRRSRSTSETRRMEPDARLIMKLAGLDQRRLVQTLMWIRFGSALPPAARYCGIESLAIRSAFESAYKEHPPRRRWERLYETAGELKKWEVVEGKKPLGAARASCAAMERASGTIERYRDFHLQLYLRCSASRMADPVPEGAGTGASITRSGP